MSLPTYAIAGASFLWPWNALMSGAVFVVPKIPDSPSLARNLTSTAMALGTSTVLVTSVWMALRPAWFASRIRNGEFLIASSFLLIAASMVYPVSGTAWYCIFMVLVVVQAVGSGSVQNGLISITQRIPGGEHARITLIGQSVAGVLPPILSILIAAPLFGGNADSSTGFGVAIGLFLSTAALSTLVLFLFRGWEVEKHIALAEEQSEQLPSIRALREILVDIRVPAYASFMAFLVSLAYPVFANGTRFSTIEPKYSAPITHLVWNTGDLCGRILCETPRFQVVRDRSFYIYGALRFLFWPVLILLARSALSWNGTALYLVVQLIFGVTNGHYLSSAISNVPSRVQPDQTPAAGGLIGMMISVGLLAGSLASFLVTPFI